MDNTEKLRVLLQHWIDHNGGHVAEFGKWQAIMVEEKKEAIAASLEKAMQQMNEVSHTLQHTLDDLGGPAGDTTHHHHHHHHHD